LTELHVAREAPLFSADDPADGLYVVMSGGVSVMLRGVHGRKRVASFAPGVVFGELGLLDGGPRSADVYADEQTIALKLTRTAFEQIRARHPDLAAKVLFNLGVEIATRLRYTNRELQQESV
jgi:SulP family sulfate permease